ncbi:MAG: glycosyltransferase [bacterium]|nr:glycosyltransferase [bacterium]
MFIVDGKKISQEIIDSLFVLPKPQNSLAAVLVGDDPASLSFLKQKQKIAEKLKIDFRLNTLPDSLTENELKEKISELSSDKSIGGIIIQLPLPSKYDRGKVLESLSLEKDVDGLSGGILPPAVATVETVLDNANFDLKDRTVAVVGRGFLVGSPISNWLKDKCDKLIVLDSRSDINQIKEADLVISGVGKAGLIKPAMLKLGAGIIDFGYDIKDGRISGDFDTDRLADLPTDQYPAFYTPTPGGTGPILVAELFRNFYRLQGLIKARVAIFSLAYLPFVGGAELAVKEITDRLPQYNFTCLTHKFESQWSAEEAIGNVRVMRTGRGRGFWSKICYIFRVWRQAEKLHRKRPFQLIWAVMAAYGGLAALLFKLRHPSVPMLLTLQEGDSEKHILMRVGIFYPFWKLIFKKANYVQVISNYLADFAQRHGAKCSVEVVPNGVDLEKFRMGARHDASNTKVIITTSRLVYKNGVDILIQSLNELEKLEITDYRLKILGSGPDEKKMKDLAQELGVADKVEFLGHIAPDEIPKYLQQADIFVRPSRSEGLGSSFLEAMAAELPIIGTDVGGIKDFLVDQETGLVCKVDDPSDLANKLKLLFDNQPLRDKVAQNGKNLVITKYSWDIITVDMKNILNKLVA